MHSLSFQSSISNAFQKPLLMITPCIDGRPLTELVQEFEQASGWTPTGGYDGIIAKVHCSGTMDHYFLGYHASDWNGGKTEILICNCGTPTCWPLLAKIETIWGDDDPDPDADYREPTVVWSNFTQPHRRERDYSAFGPFTFSRDAYVDVLAEIVAAVEKESTTAS